MIAAFPIRGKVKLPKPVKLRLEMSPEEQSAFLAAFDDEEGFRRAFAADWKPGEVIESPRFRKPRRFGGRGKVDGIAAGIFFREFRSMKTFFVAALHTGLDRDDLRLLAAQDGGGSVDPDFCDLSSGGSNLASAGVSLQKIAKAMGHASTRTTERYAKVSEASVREIASALDSVISDFFSDSFSDSSKVEDEGEGSQVSEKIGAGNGVRTRDIQLGKLTLYQLSYARAIARNIAEPGQRGNLPTGGSERDRRSRDPEQPELRGEPRQPDLREQMSVDEEDGDRIAIAPREICVGIDVDDVPFVRPVREERIDFPPHLVAEMAAGAREQHQPDHAGSGGVWGERATRRT